MATSIVEFFGFSPRDPSKNAILHRQTANCPFIGGECTKHFNDNTPSGACTIRQVTSGPVICCPNRLYASDYQILLDVAESAFGAGVTLTKGSDLNSVQKGRTVVAFGKKWGKELRLSKRMKDGKSSGSYFVDWILALLDDKGQLQEFVAVEVQTIDTTGTYKAEAAQYRKNADFEGMSAAGLNWENVNKRILPQLIYKGNVLRREPLCKKGLFFVCPTPVYHKIAKRIGKTKPYHPQTGSLTFRWYDIENKDSPGVPRRWRRRDYRG